MRINPTTARVLAAALTLCLIGLVWLYTREFPVFMNTIGVKTLVLGAMGLGALLAGALIYGFRDRFTPWDRHVPEVALTLVFTMLFMPLFVSLINRAGGAQEHQPFEFISEMPYLSSNYGILKGEKIKPSGYRLTVRKNGRVYHFQYKQQEYFPLTKPGETVLLPVRKGWLGFGIVALK